VALLYEMAISRRGKLKRDSTIGRDYIDFSDAKSVSVRLRSNNKTYSACVKDLHAKQGAIRIICYERVLDIFYYFLVPTGAYPKTSIEIPFDLDGRPSRKNKWWKYEVSTFTELCQPIFCNIKEFTISHS
jgi:hypothetical protein